MSMSRRLIIILLIVLVIGVIGGAAALVINRLRGTSSETTQTPSSGQLSEGELGGQNVVNPTGDDDGDGLTNADEALWGTDTKNPDTDGDNFLDGEEVKANFNPTIPSPNDKLPEGFKPGKDLQPLQAAASQPVAVDQFFQNNLDLTLGKKNYTEEYRKQYPEDKRTPDTLATYAQSQPIVTQLPIPEAKSIQLVADNTPLVIKDYLDVAGNLAVFSKRSVLADGLENIFANNDPAIIRGLADGIRAYQNNLIPLKVAPSAVSLQKLLLGYSQLAAATYDQIATYPEDPVRAVVAMRQLEEIDKKYMPLIEQETARLTSLAGQ